MLQSWTGDLGVDKAQILEPIKFLEMYKSRVANLRAGEIEMAAADLGVTLADGPAAAIDGAFGSFDAFKEQFTQKATTPTISIAR